MTDRLQRELAHTIAARLRKECGQDITAINRHFDELKRARQLGPSYDFDALREQREILLHASPRDTAKLAEVEAAMLALKRSPPIVDVRDLDEARQSEIRARDLILAAAMDDLRERVRAGSLTEDDTE